MIRFISLATVLVSGGFAAAHNEGESCPDGKQHHRVTIRHIESGGIGYKDGYTTLEAFLASDPSRWEVTPFLDARAHVFDNGKWAANAGAGIRTLWGSRSYGINTYYDYRNTGRFNANQIGAGLETLGELFDFRMNGYLPVGAKNSSPYDAAFAYFAGNYMYISQIYQSAMKGADAEFGFHFAESENFRFYAAAGPYYFIGEVAPATWGGKARVFGIFKDILTVEISDSYDRTFHNKFQGQVGLSFSLGPKSKVKEQRRTCKAANILNSRMLQPVDRQEIIVIDNAKKDSVAIDPATGLPYFFIFVDNTSSSDGTYESPYHSFAQAEQASSPNDVIYVFPGDGTTTGMNAGIALQANQMLLGSGVNQPIQTSAGTLSIPAHSASSPVITNTDDDTDGHAITLANNNVVSGFTITSALHDAIFGASSGSLTVSACTIEASAAFAIEATFNSNASISITNNQFLDNIDGIRLTLNGTSTFTCSNNTFDGQTSISEVPVEVTASNNVIATYFANNTFNNNTTGSIRFTLTDVVDANVSLINNTFTNNGTGSQASVASSVVFISNGTVDQCAIALRNNAFSGNAAEALYLHTSGAITTLEVIASANTMFDNGDSAIILATPVDTITLVATANTISNANNNGIAVISSGLTSTGNITISNNTITNISNFSDAIHLGQDFTTLNLTVSDNEINGCQGTGIISYAPDGVDSLILNVSGNTVSNCYNLSPNAASGLDIEQFTNFVGSVTGNTLSDNTGIAVFIGSDLTTPTACLTLTGNDSDTGYLLTNPSDGTFNLSPCDVDSVNVGTVNTYETTAVQSCPGAAPCSP